MKSNDRIILVIGACSLAMLVYGIFPNLGMTYDSHLYVEQANNLMAKGLSQDTFGAKPPLMALIYFLLFQNPFLIALSNIGCWILSMILLQRTFSTRIKNDFYQVCFSALLFLSTPIILVHNFAWTEPYYLLFISGYFYLLTKERSATNKILLILLLVAMVALKHLGISLVICFGVVYFLNSRKFLDTISTYSPSLIFFISWQFYSYHIKGDFSRLEHATDLNLIQNLSWTGQALAHWIFPFPIPSLVSILLVSALFGILTWALFKRLDDFLTACSLMVPLSLILVIATKGDLLIGDMERYLCIAYPFLLYNGLLSISKDAISSKWAVKIPVLLLITYTLIRTAKNCLQWHSIS